MNSSEAELRKLYNEIAEDFSRTRQKPWAETVQFLDSLQARWKEKTTPPALLDLGCGNGRNSLHALERGFMVFALDFSRAFLNILKKNATDRHLLSRLHLLDADLLAIPLKGSTVDSVINIAALHHLPTKEKRLRALRESKRVLKEEGTGLISVWAFDQKRFEGEYHHQLGTYPEDDERFGNVFVDWKLSSQSKERKVLKRFYHLFVRDELKALCEAAGFADVSEFRAGDNYYALVEK